MRPAVAAVLDNVIPRVAHNNHVGHGMADARQLAGHGGAKFSNNFGCGASLSLECQTQLAHHIGPLQCDLSCNGLGDLRFESLSDIGRQTRFQRLRQGLKRRGTRHIIIQCGVGVGTFIGDDLGVAIAAIGGNHHFCASVMNPVR